MLYNSGPCQGNTYSSCNAFQRLHLKQLVTILKRGSFEFLPFVSSSFFRPGGAAIWFAQGSASEHGRC